jgi:hypothetical protein
MNSEAEALSILAILAAAFVVCVGGGLFMGWLTDGGEWPWSRIGRARRRAARIQAKKIASLMTLGLTEADARSLADAETMSESLRLRHELARINASDPDA